MPPPRPSGTDSVANLSHVTTSLRHFCRSHSFPTSAIFSGPHSDSRFTRKPWKMSSHVILCRLGSLSPRVPAGTEPPPICWNTTKNNTPVTQNKPNNAPLRSTLGTLSLGSSMVFPRGIIVWRARYIVDNNKETDWRTRGEE